MYIHFCNPNPLLFRNFLLIDRVCNTNYISATERLDYLIFFYPEWQLTVSVCNSNSISATERLDYLTFFYPESQLTDKEYLLISVTDPRLFIDYSVTDPPVPFYPNFPVNRQGINILISAREPWLSNPLLYGIPC